jgi:hypothetical protein
MGRGKAERAGVSAHVLEAEGLGAANQLAQHSAPARQGTYSGVGLIIDSQGDEPIELAPVLIEDAESRVTSAGQVARGLEHVAEDGLEVELRDERARNVE